MSSKLPVFINGPITVYQLPYIPDDEFYLIDPALYAQAWKNPLVVWPDDIEVVNG